ncbi:short-chain dehydrogenase [Colletotrichum orchidophilum]|uniref:Short-chain dehydrogenase n=1 Tax=Colletotrichum orchidophilum TaxID=1209926 RepID=A0A1G4B3K2_9PEZI|nr:short-chain dehydrogenase [Colletotrichum orchidophilum]OHE96008.1 short-chain dehydrogenase [Colletotrichum orchidophilum]
MPSYLVTGVNRGIGWGFLSKLSEDANNTVIGSVRDKAAVEKKIADELGNRQNIHIVEFELGDYNSIEKSVPEVSKITGGKLDYIIANAAFVSTVSSWLPIGKQAEKPQELDEDLLKSFQINVVGNIHLFHLFLPLILKGDVKKVIAISSGMADQELVNQYRLEVSAPYSISKTGLNMAVSKFHAQYAQDGVLFMSICPGIVNTGHNQDLNEEQQEYFLKTGAIFNEYAPGVSFATPEESVNDVIKVIYDSSLENGRGGEFISHLGTKRWLEANTGSIPL